MNETRIINETAIAGWLQKLSADGRRVIAPRRKGARVEFAEWRSGDAVELAYVQTASSAKSAVFPRYEVMIRYRPAGRDWQIEDTVEARPTVLFGLHPCDAAAFATLTAVFQWDGRDAYFEAKRARMTIVGLSCAKADEYCFCTSVGLSPGSTKGCDVLLTHLAGGRLLTEVLSDAGESLIGAARESFAPANGAAREKDAAIARVEPRFAADELAQALPALFAAEGVWERQSLRCLGCGACAYVCPACSCFDIRDEKTRGGEGIRLRCWDSCGFGLFTKHASGHNPRRAQSERWRQRVMHKFSYQPERLGVCGCVGCGRCSRNCPVDMNLAENAAELSMIVKSQKLEA